VGNAVARAAAPGQGYDQGPGGYAQAQGYDAGPGYGPAQGYNAAQNYGTAQGYALAQDYDPEPAYPAQDYPGAQGGRRLYAVPDDTGATGMQPRGGQMAAYAGEPGPWDQASAIRQAAEQEAAAIRQQATDQATAIRQAAEQDAAQMRAALMAMSDELSRVAAYVSENLGNPSALATMPAPAIAPPRPVRPALAPAGPATAPARPAVPGTRPDRPARPTGPGARPGGPATRPGRPGTRPAGPATRPRKSAGKPDTKGRQARAGKKMMATLAALTAVGALVGAAQLVDHGPGFFIFRENGAGASETGLTDNQFPGHPGAPAPEPTTTTPAAPAAQPTK